MVNLNVCAAKHLSNAFSVHNGLKQGSALFSLVFNFALTYAIKEAPKDSVRSGTK
jgi:hypothetical protein